MQQTPEQIASPSVERRQFLKLAAVTGGLMAAEGSQGLLPRAAAQDASQIQVANPAFRQLYAEQRGYYIQNPAWVRDTVAIDLACRRNQGARTWRAYSNHPAGLAQCFS
ncbi:MAG: twin-arginine translocation signal domain-containing protein [Alphaproteobacteria bacterium]